MTKIMQSSDRSHLRKSAEPSEFPQPMRIQPQLRLLFWETTAGCNLACIHCRRLDVAKQMMQNDLSLAESLRLVEQVAEVGSCILVLSGGEPLIRSDLFDIAHFAVWKGLTVALATNGTLIDAEMAGRIHRSGIRRVAISIDGADETTHDDFRKQPGSLQAALAGLEHCRSRALSLQINCTVTRQNVHQLDDLYRLAGERGVDALHFFMLVPVGCGMSIADSHMLPAEEYEKVLNWIYDRSREGKMFVKATCAPHYFRVVNQRAKQDGVRPQSQKSGMHAFTRGCLAGTDICFVSHNGEVFPCGYLPVSAGNVREQSFGEIWENSPLWEGFRNTDLLEGKCGGCEFKNICLGCRARAYYQTGNYLAEEPYCNYEPVAVRRTREAS